MIILILEFMRDSFNNLLEVMNIYVRPCMMSFGSDLIKISILNWCIIGIVLLILIRQKAVPVKEDKEKYDKVEQATKERKN
jgi:hypothetical protein